MIFFVYYFYMLSVLGGEGYSELLRVVKIFQGGMHMSKTWKHCHSTFRLPLRSAIIAIVTTGKALPLVLSLELDQTWSIPNTHAGFLMDSKNVTVN